MVFAGIAQERPEKLTLWVVVFKAWAEPNLVLPSKSLIDDKSESAEVPPLVTTTLVTV